MHSSATSGLTVNCTFCSETLILFCKILKSTSCNRREHEQSFEHLQKGFERLFQTLKTILWTRPSPRLYSSLARDSINLCICGGRDEIMCFSVQCFPNQFSTYFDSELHILRFSKKTCFEGKKYFENCTFCLKIVFFCK